MTRFLEMICSCSSSWLRKGKKWWGYRKFSLARVPLRCSHSSVSSYSIVVAAIFHTWPKMANTAKCFFADVWFILLFEKKNHPLFLTENITITINIYIHIWEFHISSCKCPGNYVVPVLNAYWLLFSCDMASQQQSMTQKMPVHTEFPLYWAL